MRGASRQACVKNCAGEKYQAQYYFGHGQHFHHINPGHAEMIGIDTDGFDVKVGKQILRFNFDIAVTDALSARTALVEMAKVSRA